MGKHQSPDEGEQSRGDELVDRARNLFEFLARVQQVRTTPIRTVQPYERDGTVIWLSTLPEHAAVATSHRGEDPDPGTPLLAVDRVPRVAPPELDETLAPWVQGPLDEPEEPPSLRESLPAARVPHLVSEPGTDTAGVDHIRADEHPEVAEAFDIWLQQWSVWAEVERADAPVRDLYGTLFSLQATIGAHSEEFELVLGVGCLAWRPDGHPAVRRHLFTFPAAIAFNDDTGRLTVTREEGIVPVAVELDMLDPGLISNPKLISDVKALAGNFDGHPLHRDEIGELARRLVHSLDAEGEYSDDEATPALTATPSAAFAPALILRKRSGQGLLDIFQTIGAQLAEADEVPSGLLPLVDPDYEPAAEPDPSPGAIVTVDDEPFLPLPVNEQQRQILRAVDHRAQTVVQGPPGTGKTHTAAALLSHLLAQGKRVLVTAHTDRALKEVRDKLPSAIKPLSVAVVGTSRSDLTDLKTAVNQISTVAAERSSTSFSQDIERAEREIDNLQRRRSAAYRLLVDAREQETVQRHHGPYDGTLAAIAQTYQAASEDYCWLTDLMPVPADSTPPLTDDELGELLTLLRDHALSDDEPDAARSLIDRAAVPDHRAFAMLCDTESKAAAHSAQFADLNQHPELATISQLGMQDRRELRQRMAAVHNAAREFAQRREPWIDEALRDVGLGRDNLWRERATQISELIAQATPLVTALGPLTRVESVDGAEAAGLVSLAQHLQRHIRAGGSIKTSGDGKPRIGVLTARVVKEAAPLFEQVRVNGLPPVTDDQLTAFVMHVKANTALDALDRAWPAGVTIPEEDTLAERLQWHITELQQLTRVLEHGSELRRHHQWLAGRTLRTPAWNDTGSVTTYIRIVDAVAARDACEQAKKPLADLEDELTSATKPVGYFTGSPAAPCLHDLLAAVRERDNDAYARAHSRLSRLHRVREMVARREALTGRLDTAPQLCEAIRVAPDDSAWDTRLGRFEAAWEWASTGTWILNQDTTDVNALQAQITGYENDIRREVAKLAAARAWSHAVSPGRLTGQSRADLTQYAQLVRRLGKGTGKYAAQQRAEIRKAMDRCRPAVPVWIMPIYRIAEQFQVRENMFDVVIVDEASQAGLEATFLQYLAPKIVVIGDDKQVSPSAVGVDRQQLRDLADQYLDQDRYKASWQDPARSLFDEALMRYRGKITLVEHRRCVPEIIGFSNRIAYEPDEVRLVPVRQFGADRLEPIKPVHVVDGYERGTSAKVNPAEAQAIVDQIEKCLADPRYDGLTFGVISLLGPAQGREIESRLLERIPPEEIVARDLRCGDAADFQGSERNVIFLSMVAAPTPGRRLGALTRELNVQRYNVAVSRAKDQLWLFHSITLDDVSNREDMRFALLDYTYGVARRLSDDDQRIGTAPVPDDTHVGPFDSLFEQRVYNLMIDRGFSVIPQYPVQGYSIDLVVVGPADKLAIECDGDAWHGPDAYEADLARQRDLERCGWKFFRIRESSFYVDQSAAMQQLWDVLDELEIRPSGWVEDRAEEVHDDVRPVYAPRQRKRLTISANRMTPSLSAGRSLITRQTGPVVTLINRTTRKRRQVESAWPLPRMTENLRNLLIPSPSSSRRSPQCPRPVRSANPRRRPRATSSRTSCSRRPWFQLRRPHHVNCVRDWLRSLPWRDQFADTGYTPPT